MMRYGNGTVTAERYEYSDRVRNLTNAQMLWIIGKWLAKWIVKAVTAIAVLMLGWLFLALVFAYA